MTADNTKCEVYENRLFLSLVAILDPISYWFMQTLYIYIF